MTHPQRGSRGGRNPDDESQQVQQTQVDMPGHHGVCEEVDNAPEDQTGVRLHPANVGRVIGYHAGPETRQDAGWFGNNKRM